MTEHPLRKVVDHLRKIAGRQHSPAEDAIRAVLAGKPSLEMRLRAQGLLEMLEISRSPDRLRELRAVEVLEHLGTPAAIQILESVSQGAPEARLTREAKAALQWLARRKLR